MADRVTIEELNALNEELDNLTHQQLREKIESMYISIKSYEDENWELTKAKAAIKAEANESIDRLMTKNNRLQDRLRGRVLLEEKTVRGQVVVREVN